MLGQAASGSALPMNAFCISSYKTAPASQREETGGLQPALTQLMMPLVGVAADMPMGTSPRSIPGAKDTPSRFAGRGLPPHRRTERSSPLGDGGEGRWGSRPGGAGELTRLPGTWKWGGKGRGSIRS